MNLKVISVVVILLLFVRCKVSKQYAYHRQKEIAEKYQVNMGNKKGYESFQEFKKNFPAKGFSRKEFKDTLKKVELIIAHWPDSIGLKQINNKEGQISFIISDSFYFNKHKIQFFKKGIFPMSKNIHLVER